MKHTYYKHDCNKCIPLGKYIDSDGLKSDLYYCPTMKDLVARYGDDPANYSAYPAHFDGLPEKSQEAKRRAINLQLI